MVRIVNQRNIRQQQKLRTLCTKNYFVICIVVCLFIGLTSIIITFIYLSVQYTQQHVTSNENHFEGNVNTNLKKTDHRTDTKMDNVRRNKIESEKAMTSSKANNGQDVDVVTTTTNAIETPKSIQSIHPPCPYMKFNDLTDTERHPKAGNGTTTGWDRHMVTPPNNGNMTLVCCHTTVGPWNIVVHTNWAPIGAQRFLDMVQSSYFDSSVPFMRCIKDFLCQFGLNGEPSQMKPYKKTLPDDPNWLPEGPEYRFDKTTGIRRFSRGYLAYAGAGKHSRDIQFIVALKNNGPLGGGSPWEVPWGELVGEHSYDTLSKIYTGYDEHGPSQGLLHQANALDIVKEKYPLIDYIQSCTIVDQHIHIPK
jgi:cyclophilin family peptidyl-prolyl cis-trans isomerase